MFFTDWRLMWYHFLQYWHAISHTLFGKRSLKLAGSFSSTYIKPTVLLWFVYPLTNWIRIATGSCLSPVLHQHPYQNLCWVLKVETIKDKSDKSISWSFWWVRRFVKSYDVSSVNETIPRSLIRGWILKEILSTSSVSENQEYMNIDGEVYNMTSYHSTDTDVDTRFSDDISFTDSYRC